MGFLGTVIPRLKKLRLRDGAHSFELSEYQPEFLSSMYTKNFSNFYVKQKFSSKYIISFIIKFDSFEKLKPKECTAH